MASKKSQLRLLDVLIEMFPGRKEKLERAAIDFYTSRQGQFGEHLISHQVVNCDELALALTKQHFAAGKVTRADKIVLTELQDRQHARARQLLGHIAALCQRPAMARSKN